MLQLSLYGRKIRNEGVQGVPLLESIISGFAVDDGKIGSADFYLDGMSTE